MVLLFLFTQDETYDKKVQEWKSSKSWQESFKVENQARQNSKMKAEARQRYNNNNIVLI